MVRKKVIWSQTAISELENILAFYIQRNQSETYSLWLYQEVEKRVNIISLFPAIGRKTDLQHVHILPFENYGIIYKITTSTIYIMSVWDFRQKPNQRIDKKTDSL
jgi:plasmid stabilization system protein ParE